MARHIFDTSTKFGTISRIFHWIMAFLLISLWSVGFSLANGLIPPEAKKDMMSNHKSLGIIALSIAVLRVLWRFSNNISPESKHFPKSSQILSKLNTWLFYGLMFIFPLSGILMSLLNGRNIGVFGVTLISPFSSNLQSQELAKLAWQIHGISGKLFVLAFALHILGAIYHQFFLKDNLIKRMAGK